MLLQVQREKDRVKQVDIILRQTRLTCNSGYPICRSSALRQKKDTLEEMSTP